MFSSHRLLLAAAIAIPVALLVLAGVLNFTQLRAEAERDARHTAAGLSEHALRTIRAHEIIIEVVDMQIQGREWNEIRASADLHRLLRQLMGQSRDVSSIFVLDPSGRVARSPQPRTRKLPRRNEPAVMSQWAHAGRRVAPESHL